MGAQGEPPFSLLLADGVAGVLIGMVVISITGFLVPWFVLACGDLLKVRFPKQIAGKQLVPKGKEMTPCHVNAAPTSVIVISPWKAHHNGWKTLTNGSASLAASSPSLGRPY